MVYGIYNELVTGAYKPTYILGASHCKNGEQNIINGIPWEIHGKSMGNSWNFKEYMGVYREEPL